MTIQEWYIKLLEQIKRERALQQVQEAANDKMYLYHKGRLQILVDTAENLVIWFGVEAVKEEEEKK